MRESGASRRRRVEERGAWQAPAPIVATDGRPICRVCKARPCRKAGKPNPGWQTRCWKCADPTRVANHKARHHLTVTKGMNCRRCGFVAEHPIQIACHHLDHNSNNHAPDNLVALCHNCNILLEVPGYRDWRP